MGLLCYYGGTIIDVDNNITYHRESNKFFSLTLDSLFVELKKLVCGGIW
jgi:hypothetical protein